MASGRSVQHSTACSKGTCKHIQPNIKHYHIMQPSTWQQILTVEMQDLSANNGVRSNICIWCSDMKWCLDWWSRLWYYSLDIDSCFCFCKKVCMQCKLSWRCLVNVMNVKAVLSCHKCSTFLAYVVRLRNSDNYGCPLRISLFLLQPWNLATSWYGKRNSTTVVAADFGCMLGCMLLCNKYCSMDSKFSLSCIQLGASILIFHWLRHSVHSINLSVWCDSISWLSNHSPVQGLILVSFYCTLRGEDSEL